MKFSVILILIIAISNIYGVELTRLNPGNNSKAEFNQMIKFSIQANDTKGLAYSKWQLSGKLMDKHILTGSSKFDEWYHSFNRTGTFFVSVAVYNIDGNSEMIIWKINIEGDKQSVPTIAEVNPSGSYISIDEGHEEVFKIDISDEDCQLDRIEWLVDGEIKESNSLDGCSKREQFYYSFYSARDYEVCANVFNSRGSKESKCWKVDVNRKSSNYIAGNNNGNSGQSTPNYSNNSTPKSKRKLFIGLSYSSRELVSTQSFDGYTFGDFFDGNPTSYELSVRSRNGVLGAQAAFWQMSGDFQYGLGSFSQTGFRAEILMNIGVEAEPIAFNIYFGAGGVYQNSTLEINYDKQENDGYGYSYLGGLEVVFGRTFVVFTEYNGISSKSGDLEVGSSGLAIGAGIRF